MLTYKEEQLISKTSKVVIDWVFSLNKHYVTILIKNILQRVNILILINNDLINAE